MSIIWCGGEDIDFPNGHIPSGAASACRTNYSRIGLVSLDGFAKSNIFTAISSGWLRFFRFKNMPWNQNIRAYDIGIVDYSSNKGLFFGRSAVDDRIGIFTYNGTSTYALLAAETGNSAASHGFFDIHITDFGVTSVIKVYKDGQLIIDFSGDSSISGISTLNCISLYTNLGGYYSEFIVANEDTRLMSLKTLAPNAVGDSSDWNGAYTTIDEITKSDADVVYTSEFDQDFMCNLTGMPVGDFICKGVKIATRVTDGIGGIGVQVGVKTNSEVDVSDTHELGGVFETVEQLYQENPITNNRFTPAEIDALQVVLRSKEIVV